MQSMKRLFLFLCTIAIFAGSYYYINLYIKDHTKTYLHLVVKSEMSDQYQVFFSTAENTWNEDNSSLQNYSHQGEWEDLKFELPSGYSFIRIDTGKSKGEISIDDIYFSGNSNVKVNIGELGLELNQIKIVNDGKKGGILLNSTGIDPYFSFNIESLLQNSKNHINIGMQLFALLTSLLIAGASFFVGKALRETLQFVRSFFENQSLIMNLAKNDFKTKYASSYLGILWGFINPLLTIATYWFVFQVGLRSGDIGDTPFIIWFIAGIIPWFFFSEALSSTTNSFAEYSYLVKKVVFKIELLPLVKILSAFFVQLFFIVFIFVVYGFYGHLPTIYSLQLIYYVFCLIVLVVSLAFFTSAVVLFFKDLNQIIAVILQMGFWFTPIGWSVSMLSDFWERVFKLNPMFYIVQGYRDSLIDHIFIFDRPYQMVYFWMFCLVMFTFSMKVFKKLRPHFSDVL
ncbi:ABC transporter permease [Paenibacillus sp. IHBB 3054]|uniref:ABC transporter permease n=1 Tax=Paenibacillus sp. IHBB 3054 TaxID=3425689 RepID=UPI003F676CEA